MYKTNKTMKQLEQVTEFHKAFGHGVGEAPRNITPHKQDLRYALMKEENEEYLEAVREDDIVGIADALGDMMYILCGTILEHGLQGKIEAVFDEIQRSNMSKLGKDGKPIYREDGKILKGEDYFKPNLKAILDGN